MKLSGLWIEETVIHSLSGGHRIRAAAAAAARVRDARYTTHDRCDLWQQPCTAAAARYHIRLLSYLTRTLATTVATRTRSVVVVYWRRESRVVCLSPMTTTVIWQSRTRWSSCLRGHRQWPVKCTGRSFHMASTKSTLYARHLSAGNATILLRPRISRSVDWIALRATMESTSSSTALGLPTHQPAGRLADWQGESCRSTVGISVEHAMDTMF